MKQLLFCILMLCAARAEAQWQEDLGLGGHDPYVSTFGVHDTSLFAMWFFPPPQPPEHPTEVYLLARNRSTNDWGPRSNGIGFSEQETVTSFASLGAVFFCGRNP